MNRFLLICTVCAFVVSGCSINASDSCKTKSPDAARVYAKYAETLLSQGKYEEAQKMATRSEKVHVPWNVELTTIKARVKLAEMRPDILRNGDWSLLKTDLLILHDKVPSMARDINVIKGHLAMAVSDFDKAKGFYKGVLAKDPTNPGALFGLGWLYRLQGKTDESIDEFKAGLQKDPNNYGALVALGDLNMKQKHNTDAAKYYGMAVKVHPDSIEAAKGLVQALYRQKKIAWAMNWLNKLIKRAPKDPDVFLWRGQILSEQKKWSEAIQMLSRAVMLGSGLNASVLLARAYIAVKQYANAESVIKTALKQARGNLELHYLLAVTLDQMGRKQDALKLYTGMLNAFKSMDPKIAARLAGVRKLCESSVKRLTQELGSQKGGKQAHKTKAKNSKK